MKDAAGLQLHHDDAVQVFLNGVLAYEDEGAVGDYKLVPITPEAKNVLKEGENLIAVHCHQKGGGQFIDVGLSTTAPVK